jgi:hypothetical protein
LSMFNGLTMFTDWKKLRKKNLVRLLEGANSLCVYDNGSRQ